VRAPEFVHSQEGMLHFQHLLSVNGGLLHVADDLDAHLDQIGAVLTGRTELDDKSRRFVEAFVRPHGLDRPATPILAEAIEALASVRRAVVRKPVWIHPVRCLFYPLAALVAWLPESRPLWVYALRPVVWVFIRTAAVLYGLRETVHEAARKTREASRYAIKRVRRTVYVAWYESNQAIRRGSRRAMRRFVKVVLRTGSLAKRTLFGAERG